MERAFALKAQDQPTRLRHFGGVIFDHIFGFKRTADFARGYFALKHALNRMGAVENFGHGVIIHLCRCEAGTCTFRRSNLPQY